MSALASPRERVFAGILLTSLAYFLFTVHDAAVKLLVAAIPVWQVLFFRSLTILAGCAVFGGPALFRDAIRSPIVKPMFLRSFLILGAWLCYYNAARSLQLAELTTIYYAAPIIVTVLSVIVLKESVPLARWAAVFGGFAGVFIACDPARLGLSLPVLLVLAAAFMWGTSIILLRKIAMQEKTIVQMILNNGFFLFTAGVPLAWVWQTPSASQSLLLLGAGMLAGLAQFTLFEGMRRAEASVIAPFEYTALVWAFALGYLIWADVPRLEVFVGASLIMAAGLLVVASEHRRGRVAKEI
jgi:drug/metabolite transporter (DMT)-like permease